MSHLQGMDPKDFVVEVEACADDEAAGVTDIPVDDMLMECANRLRDYELRLALLTHESDGLRVSNTYLGKDLTDAERKLDDVTVRSQEWEDAYFNTAEAFDKLLRDIRLLDPDYQPQWPDKRIPMPSTASYLAMDPGTFSNSWDTSSSYRIAHYAERSITNTNTPIDFKDITTS